MSGGMVATNIHVGGVRVANMPDLHTYTGSLSTRLFVYLNKLYSY